MQNLLFCFATVIFLVIGCFGNEGVPSKAKDEAFYEQPDHPTEDAISVEGLTNAYDDTMFQPGPETDVSEIDFSSFDETAEVTLDEVTLHQDSKAFAEPEISDTGLDREETQEEDISNEAVFTDIGPSVPEAEFVVNTWTGEHQRLPFVASLKDGGFVVVWQSGCDYECDAQDGSEWGIYGQRFDALGNKVGYEFAVNTYTPGSQTAPVVASLEDGGFVVIFESLGQDGSGYGVYGQRFDYNGNRLGSEFRVNTFTAYDQNYPWVTRLGGGGFVVVWQSFGQDGSHFGVFGQRFNADGSLLAIEFQVNTYTTQFQGLPTVAPSHDGGFIVVWQGTGADGAPPGSGIAGQVFDQNGEKVGDEFVVNTWTTGSQLHPRIDWFPDGGGVVVWTGKGEGNLDGIFGQVFDHNWNKKGVEFRADEEKKWDPGVGAVACFADGRFVVVWEKYGSDESEWDVFAQKFDSEGIKVGTEFFVNQWTTGFQRYPIVESLGDDRFVVVWESKGVDGSGYGIVARIFAM